MSDRRSAIVVGGAGGIGTEICRRFAADGYRVIVADIDAERAREVSAGLPGAGHDAVAVDVTDEASVERTFDAIETAGAANVLVVAAGGPVLDGPPPTIAEVKTANWHRSIGLNLTGVFYCVRKFAQQRLAEAVSHPRIVIISSGTGQVSSAPMETGYVSAKTALIGLTRQAAFDLAPAQITVNAVAPGVVGTPEFFRNTSEEFRTHVAAATLLKRLGRPEEISAGVVYLASEEASFITGTTLDINGGAHMH
jgi:NAD(P)-dependent dehydrogenase (short-subunit alcohol dehydrogenase family)